MGNLKPFKKGQSGNPGGRPKVIAEVRDLARTHSPKALETLVSIAADKKQSPSARVAAANSILDRGYGKPAQTVLTRRLTEMTEQEIIDFIGYDPGTEELSSLASTRPAGSA